MEGLREGGREEVVWGEEAYRHAAVVAVTVVVVVVLEPPLNLNLNHHHHHRHRHCLRRYHYQSAIKSIAGTKGLGGFYQGYTGRLLRSNFN